MKRYWYIALSEKQFENLKEGLLSHFRFYIRLSVPTVEYNREEMELTVLLPTTATNELQERISCYINGFWQAIK